MISVKCPFCGATININKATNVQKCSACGNEFLLEHNDELNEQTLIDNGNIFLDFKEYQKAINCFEKACEIAPENYAVWVGLSKAESENFSVFNNNNIFKIQKYYDHAKSVAKGNELEIVEKEMKPFVDEKNRKEKELKQKRKQADITSATYALFTICFLSCVVINIWSAINSDASSFWKVVTAIIMSGFMFFFSFVTAMAMDKIQPKTGFGIFLYFFIVILEIVIITSFCLYITYLI